MSVLYLHFETDERPGRVARLQKSGAHVVVAEPRWPGFFELAKREKPYAIALDFSQAPSHALETADYLSKAKETRDATLFLLRVPADRQEAVTKRLPQATILTENELSGKLAQMEQEAAKKAARAAGAAARAAAAGKGKPPAAPAKPKPAGKTKAATPAPKKKAAKKPAAAKKPQPKKKK
jgi:hypothetical protein